MCTSYFIDNARDDHYMASITSTVRSSGLANRMREKLGKPVTIYGRIKPGDIVPVIAPDSKTGNGKVFPMVWGFTGQTQETSSAESRRQRTVIASARSENAENSRLFGESWGRKRCLVPASWYYEWEHLRPSTDTSAPGINGNQERNVPADPQNRSSGSRALGNKYMLQPFGEVHLLIAGLYRIETETDGSRFPHFVILTRPAGEEIRFIHDRMPVIIDPFSTEPEFFIPEEDIDIAAFSGKGTQKAYSGKKPERTPRQEEYDEIQETGFGAENSSDQPLLETSPYYWSGNMGRFAARDWINPGTGSWRLQEIIRKSIKNLMYEKC